MVNLGISLVVQCLGVPLPIQGTWVRFLVREDPTCHGATKPMLCNYWSQHPRAHAQHQEKPPHWEAQALQQQRTSTAKNKLKRNSKKKVTVNLDDILNDIRHIYHGRRNQGNIWPGEGSLLLNMMGWHHGWKTGASSVFLPPKTLWPPSMDIKVGSTLPTKGTLSRKVFQKWRINKNFPRQSKPDGVHHH